LTWTSGEIKNWTSERSLQFAPIYPVLNTFVLAIKERLRILGVNVDDWQGGGKSLEMKYCAPYVGSIESTFFGFYDISEFIEDYVIYEWGREDGGDSEWVNYKDSNGDWDKQATAPKMWTKDDILTYLGQSEYIKMRYSVDALETELLAPFLASWVRQIYRMLNLFRWIRPRVSVLNNPGNDEYYFKTSTGADYDIAASNWPSNWTETSGLIEGTDCFSEVDGGIVNLYRAYIKNHTYDAGTSVLNHDVDLYFYSAKPIRTISPAHFRKQRTTFIENTYANIGSYAGRSTVTGTIDFRDFLSSDTPTFRPPNDGADYGWEFGGRHVDPPNYAVVKFDVTGGLEYVTDVF